MDRKSDAHTERVIELAEEIGKQTVVSLREAEKEGLQKIDKFNDSIEEKINQFQHMCERISASMEAKPEPAFFKSFKNSDLEKN